MVIDLMKIKLSDPLFTRSDYQENFYALSKEINLKKTAQLLQFLQRQRSLLLKQANLNHLLLLENCCIRWLEIFEEPLCS